MGDYQPPHYKDHRREPLGCDKDSYFETMVFQTKSTAARGVEECGCHEVISWGEVDARRYATAGAAQRGHEAMIRKYLRKQARA